MKIFTGFSTFISTQMERVLLPQTITVLLNYKLQNSVPFKSVYFDLSATNIEFEIMNCEPTLSLTKD